MNTEHGEENVQVKPHAYVHSSFHCSLHIAVVVDFIWLTPLAIARGPFRLQDPF